MKIIFSRKGFDSKFGGVASPIFESGKMLSLPIPDPTSSVRFCDLGWDTLNLGVLVKDLTREKISQESGVHHDPDLRAEAISRRTGWLPMFGQDNAAQSHLKNRGVGDGDIFLFFGWFRKVFQKNGCWSYVPNAPDIHVLFGWLQIGELHEGDLSSYKPPFPEWKKEHPHFNPAYKNNCLYVAAPHLAISLISKSLPGGGTFPRFHENLQLTAAGRTRSIWRMPAWIHPEGKKSELSYHRADSKYRTNLRWTPKAPADSFVSLKTVDIGQEFVLNCDHYPQSIPWLRDLFNECT